MHAPTSRNAAFDAVKGVLVLLMIVYHVMSIASTAGAEAFRYVRFISGSFIFISGFIVSRFFASSFEKDPAATSRKLLGRGLKVLLIFTALNVLIQASGFGNAAKRQLRVEGLFEDAVMVYMSGDGSIASFVVLLPIAYLLIAAPAFLLAAGTRGPTLSCALLAATLAACAIPGGADRSIIIEFMLVGATGLCAGVLPVATVPPLRTSTNTALAIGGLAGSLWLAGRFGDNPAVYCIGVALILKFLHDGAHLIDADGAPSRLAVRLGRYSLVCYIAQIATIQALFRATGMRRWDPGFGVAMCLFTGVLMFALCMALDGLRARSSVVDRSYRSIFS